MKPGNAIAVLTGVLLIAVITPLSGFLTLAGGGENMETTSPAGWVVGTVFALAAGCWLVRLASGRNLFGKGQLVIILCMLASAVPIMNVGLVRPVVERMDRSVMDYIRSGGQSGWSEYQSVRRGWFPVVPSEKALALGKARRLVELMDDPQAGATRRHALAELRIRLAGASEKNDSTASRPAATAPVKNQPILNYHVIMTILGIASDNPSPLPMPESRPASSPTADSKEILAALVAALGVDEIGQLRTAEARGEFTAEAVEKNVLRPLIAERLRQAESQSSYAAGKLPDMLKDFDEAEAYRMPQNLALLGPASEETIRLDDRILSDSDRTDLQGGIERLKPQFAAIRQETARLSETDRFKVIHAVADQYAQQFAEMPGDKYDRIRNSFMARLPAEQRKELLNFSLAGDESAVNNIGTAARRASANPDEPPAGPKSLWQKISFCWRHVPWHIWVAPLAAWGLLIMCAFLFLLCLAEYLRPSWVVRQDLAFPLVEAAQRLIEPDKIGQSQGPGRLNRMLLAGSATGFAVICLQAMNHYGIVPESICSFDLRCDLSGLFLMGDGSIVLAISPIVVGIAFLISLEMSFSIWFAFLILAIGFGIFGPSGLTAGMQTPSPLPLASEQLFGASLVLAAVLLVQAWRNNKSSATTLTDGERLMNPKLARVGMVVLPVAILVCVWNMGMGGFSGIGLLLLAGLIVLAQTVASARARAQAGLPIEFAVADLTGMPWLAGLAGLAGQKVLNAFSSAAILPAGALMRLLGQNMDNMVLARRNGVKLGTLAIGTILAGLTAVSVGMVCSVVFGHFAGSAMPAGPAAAVRIAPAEGVSAWSGDWSIGLVFVAGGAILAGLLLLARRKFPLFPVHPIGYLVVLLSLQQGSDATGRQVTCLIWGGVMLAWIIKKLILARGGSEACNRARPFFIGLVLGAILCAFAWNIVHLILAMVMAGKAPAAGFIGQFISVGPLNLRIF